MKNGITLIAAILLLSAFTLRIMLHGPDISGMDKKVSPRVDFYQFANGNWIKNNPVPAAEARWSSFNIVDERNMQILKRVMEESAAGISPSPIRQRIGDLYSVIMDTLKLESDGVAPVKPLLDEVDKISNFDDIIRLLGKYHRMGISPLFNLGTRVDEKNSEAYAVYASQGGLGMPDRDYYLKDDDRSQELRTEYIKHITRMFELFGHTKQEGNMMANKIMEFETGLAKVSMTKAERRNIEKQYNKKTIKELQALTPLLSWDTYFAATGYKQKKFDSVVVQQPGFMAYVSSTFTSMPLSSWKAYLKWNIMNASASCLNKEIGEQNFYFYGKVLTGQKEQKPRWKRAISSSNGMIGELIGQEYVKMAFSAESKRRLNEMVDGLMQVYRRRIIGLHWMSQDTKTKALEKLGTIGRKIGYPDKWESYTGLLIVRDSYLANHFRAREWSYQDNLNKLGQPVDKTKWSMLPQTVNAYYNASFNEIVFPAAIMQPPFFNPDVDDAVNYGSIGAVIGHEISHGFDDKGSTFDAKGNFKNWWTDDDRKKFEDKANLLVAQFNRYTVVDSLTINGKLTLGENIADLAGLSVAYEAYMISLQGKLQEVIDGYTPAQRFFIGFGQVWKASVRPEFLRQQVVTDFHSPARFRVMGPLSNMPEFYAAFDVKAGDPMWRPEDDRAKIW